MGSDGIGMGSGCDRDEILLGSSWIGMGSGWGRDGIRWDRDGIGMGPTLIFFDFLMKYSCISTPLGSSCSDNSRAARFFDPSAAKREFWIRIN